MAPAGVNLHQQRMRVNWDGVKAWRQPAVFPSETRRRPRGPSAHCSRHHCAVLLGIARAALARMASSTGSICAARLTASRKHLSRAPALDRTTPRSLSLSLACFPWPLPRLRRLCRGHANPCRDRSGRPQSATILSLRERARRAYARARCVRRSRCQCPQCCFSP
jgi:hypothetical protein